MLRHNGHLEERSATLRPLGVTREGQVATPGSVDVVLPTKLFGLVTVDLDVVQGR